MSKPCLFFLVASLLLMPWGDLRAATSEDALKKSSPFTDFTLNQVEGGQILESRQGASASPSVEAVQTCFLLKASPDKVAAKLKTWTPAGKSGLEVSNHQKLSSRVTPDVFAGTLNSVFKTSGGDANWIVQQSQNALKPDCELLLNSEEKHQLAAATTSSKLTSAWSEILSHRFNSFRDHGSADFSSLISAVAKLGVGSIPSPSGGASYYWEMADVSHRGSISLGVTWSDAPDGKIQIFDGEFFVTSEYAASLNVNTLWPVTVNGKPATLVWRIDSALSNQFTSLSGAERIASASLILSSAKKAIEALRQEVEK
jgi:hypothetical protein